MNTLLSGITVERNLPAEILIGLITGAYKAHGSVIRWGPGTELAGQIVRHLIPVGASAIPASTSLAASVAPFLATGALVGGHVYGEYKIKSLSTDVTAILSTAKETARRVDQLTTITQQILKVSNSLMLMSGLNLAVSVIGFSVLYNKIKTFESSLNKIQNDIKDIKDLLLLEEKSKLAAVLRDLVNIDSISNPEHRNSILLNSKNVLAPISLKYKELLSGAQTIETAMIYEEYYCLTSIAHSRCLAELGIIDMAKKDLEEVAYFWNKQARRITTDLLFKDKPERFLHSDFSKNIPISELAEWCDFAYENNKGYGWIDELRGKIDPWYTKERGLEISNPFNKTISPQKKIETQLTTFVPSIQKLVARHNVLNGFVGEYELLEKHKVTPSNFQKWVLSMKDEAILDGYLILAP